MDQVQRDFMVELQQLIANARENATADELVWIDRVERQGLLMMTQKEGRRLQEIADR